MNILNFVLDSALNPEIVCEMQHGDSSITFLRRQNPTLSSKQRQSDTPRLKCIQLKTTLL
jgi:hypothetical protein